MILTGRKLEEIGHALYGEIWVSMLSRKLKRSKRTVMRWRSGDFGIPAKMRQQLVDMIDEQFAVLAEKRDYLMTPTDDAQ
ncbi:MAG TPA: hypothetical protein DEQ40_14365 [Oxalobacteraceae bacterium]|jgi:hypothetical protein|nr:hypothetical protein [Oxalobacteraceae bacterium]